LEILLTIGFWNEYQVKKIEMQERIHMDMKLCAFTIDCNDFTTDFITRREDTEENILYQDGDFYGYFKVPTVKKYLMKVIYSKEKYLLKIENMKNKLYYKFGFYSILLIVISFIFSMYALMPLRKALYLNEEFVKDILHDFNTPISSMLINFSIFKKEIGENIRIKRLENNIQTILSLQENLQFFLKSIPSQSDQFLLNDLVLERINYFKIQYSNLTYTMKVDAIQIDTNKSAFIRILDNIISNACKYNSAEGKVNIVWMNPILYIEDSGKGIKNPAKVFDRYYKEQDRGIGIGLHIVQKLSEELHITISMESQRNKGTKIGLDLSHCMVSE